jgi:hypothetical protein
LEEVRCDSQPKAEVAEAVPLAGEGVFHPEEVDQGGEDGDVEKPVFEVKLGHPVARGCDMDAVPDGGEDHGRKIEAVVETGGCCVDDEALFVAL